MVALGAVQTILDSSIEVDRPRRRAIPRVQGAVQQPLKVWQLIVVELNGQRHVTQAA